MDNLSTAQRSAQMARIRSENTRPELVVRRLLHAMGFRFRLHRRDLPGNPDLVLPRFRTAVFVNGCFWHNHDCARGAREPRQNAEYWRAKRRRNSERDERNYACLVEAGWQVVVIWECELRDPKSLRHRFGQLLDRANLRRRSNVDCD
ncbi:very short patch repair endonuclease [Inquilinus sp. NPDC058860]|uniref:very short patch repair endonuclease n=1 Tax=Inquilinus sp. NPDC058860 TaxID=3346652 RepID=UPI0036AC6C99